MPHMCVEMLYVPGELDAEAGHRFVDAADPRRLMTSCSDLDPIGWHRSFRNDARFRLADRVDDFDEDDAWADVRAQIRDWGELLVTPDEALAIIDGLPAERRERYWEQVTETAHLFVDALARMPEAAAVWVDVFGLADGGSIWSTGAHEDSVGDQPFLDTMRACSWVFPDVALAMGAYIPDHWILTLRDGSVEGTG